MKKFILKLAMIVFTLSPVGSAWAGDAGSSRTVSIGAGISSPSRTSALVENPAGLTLNETTRVQGDLSSSSSDFSPLGYGGGIFFGNGNAGGAVQIQRTAGDQTLLDLGLAAQLESLALGVHVQHGLSSGDGWDADIGAIFNPKNKVRVGAEVFGVVGGPDGYGAGVASNVSPDATIAVDGSVDKDIKGLTIKPTLGIDLRNIQMVFGYGIQIDDNASSRIPEGAAVGLGLRLTDSAHLVGYYNQIAKYYVGVIFKL